MKRRTVIIIRLIIFLAVMLSVLLTRNWWFPILVVQFGVIEARSNLLEGLAAIIDISGFFLMVASIFISYFAVCRHEQREEQDSDAPLRPASVDQLKAQFIGRSSRVNWIDRKDTSPDLLIQYRRLVICGRMKLGKTREAIELNPEDDAAYNSRGLVYAVQGNMKQPLPITPGPLNSTQDMPKPMIIGALPTLNREIMKRPLLT